MQREVPGHKDNTSYNGWSENKEAKKRAVSNLVGEGDNSRKDRQQTSGEGEGKRKC